MSRVHQRNPKISKNPWNALMTIGGSNTIILPPRRDIFCIHYLHFSLLHSRVVNGSAIWGKVLRFFHHHLHTFMVFQLYKTAVSVSAKVSCSSCKFSLKLSLAYSEMDESTLLTHMCADSRMTIQLLKGGEELQLK